MQSDLIVPEYILKYATPATVFHPHRTPPGPEIPSQTNPKHYIKKSSYRHRKLVPT